jgi:hypothetical protein
MNTNTMPIVRIELQSMRLSMVHAFHDMQLKMDEMAKQAIDDALDPKRIQEMMTRTAREEIDRVILEETNAFFRYGPGRKVIAEIVAKKLSEDLE